MKSGYAKSLFLETLARCREKYPCRFLNFMVMENHIHRLLEPLVGAALADLMRWILGVYTLGYNRIFKTWGYVWGGRYFSRPIDGFVDLSATFKYSDENPVRAGLVASATDWRWCALHHYRPGSRFARSPGQARDPESSI